MSAPRLPTFLVIGAMKAGTTSLYEYLRGHPQVFMAAKKELDYFPPGNTWQRGPDWYRSQFADAGDAIAVGEASPTYAHDPLHRFVPERIHDLVPDVRLVYLVREPIERIQSQYRHRLRYDGERQPPTAEVLAGVTYLAQSRYAHQIERYLACFPREQLLVVQSERLRDDRHETMRRILGFIGVDADALPPNLGEEYLRSPPPTGVRRAVARARSLLSKPDPSAISDDTCATLRGLLTDDVARLRAHLDPDFDAWGWQLPAA